ncbi:MAG: flagellin [Candidatus Puniceispirillales bacterium]
MASVNTNMGSLVAQANMGKQERAMNTAMERLSSGLRINSAADDAAGSAIASKLTSQVKSLGQAIRNANDAISLTQTAEGALGEVENILQRMRELSVQSGNDTLNSSDRSQIQGELDQLAAEIDAISQKTNFNRVNLLDGSNDKLTIQMGIDATDTLDIALKKTTVESLGIGSSSTAAVNQITSGRITTLATFTNDDIKINGQNITSADVTGATATFSKAGTTNNTVNITAAVGSATQHAAALAELINTNTANHNVVATAFNEVKAGTNVFTSGDVTINGTTVLSRNSKEEFVAAVNSEVANVDARIDADGFVIFSNDSGYAINFSGANPELGILDDAYGGFVTLKSVDNSPITIQAGSKQNGYGADEGKRADLATMGFNESNIVNGKLAVSGNVYVDDNQLTGADGLKINGVLITELDGQDTNSKHATDKVAQINAKTDEHGVVATAFNQVKLTVDMVGATMANHSDLAINGITINVSADATITDLVEGINTGLQGKVDLVASIEADTGAMLLTSNTGVTITINDGDSGGLFTAGTYVDGSAFSDAAFATGAGVAKGFITLQSQDGTAIKIEDGARDNDADNGADRIGFASQNEAGNATAGVSVGTVASANAALSTIDSAIESVSKFRASFGAYENRLDAAINNLVTLQVNTDAARSRIEDADFAGETSQLTKAQILSQAATSMLAQANASKNSLLALLQG